MSGIPVQLFEALYQLELVKRNRAIDLYELVQDYLSDPSSALQTLLATFLNMVMLCEVEIQAETGYYERSDHRTATRNGYTERGLKTRFGDIRLLKPEFCEKPF